MSISGSCPRGFKVASADPPAPQHAVAVVKYDGLTRRDAILRLSEIDVYAILAEDLDLGPRRNVQVANLCCALKPLRDVIDQLVEAIGLQR